MAATITPSAATRAEIRRRGGASAALCYQCGTCSAACELATRGRPFPRRQMLLAQWGLASELSIDPAVWLCHQCNDCTERCPREARPGDVMQTARAIVVEQLAAPRFMGRLVAGAGRTWPLLLGIPLIFWVVLLAATGGLGAPQLPKGELFAYEDFVPHSLIYAVFFPVAALVMGALFVSGRRFWSRLRDAPERSGSFLANLTPALIEIASHKRFASCTTAHARRWGHFLLLWGFVGAAITSALLIVGIYILHEAMPLPMGHPFKILGNLSAVLLVVGGFMLLNKRLTSREEAGASTAFDHFFLGVVVLVIATGVVTELGRLYLDLTLSCWLYIVHLAAVLCLFLTCPYSKFAHLLYRTLAMVHERMVATAVEGKQES